MPKIVDHAQRRDEVASIAAELIATNGLHNTTIRDVASKSGHSRSIVEHYFKNKEDLVESTLEWANQRYSERVDAAVLGKTGLDAIKARMKAALPLDESIRLEWSIRMQFWSLLAVHALDDSRQPERTAVNVERYRDDLRSAREKGELVDGISISGQAHELANVVGGLSVNAMHSPQFYTPRKMTSMVNRIVARLSRV